MTVGNLVALRQTNIVRMLAYSSVAQGGFILVPLAVAQEAPAAALEAVVTYLLIYAAMNLGAFAVVIAVSRRTRSAEISSYAGLGQFAPVLAILMSVFLFSLAGVPPLAGWYAKFMLFRAVLDAGTPWADRARRDRGRELGDRVLLLRGGRPADVVRGAGDRGLAHGRDPRRAGRRDLALRRDRRRHRHLPAALRPPRGARTVLDRRAGRPSRRSRSSERIHREGPVPYSAFVGLRRSTSSSRHGGAGRAGRRLRHQPGGRPALRCPVARALDGWFAELGSPDPFLVVEAGAGRGRLRGDVLRADPAARPRCGT